MTVHPTYCSSDRSVPLQRQDSWTTRRSVTATPVPARPRDAARRGCALREKDRVVVEEEGPAAVEDIDRGGPIVAVANDCARAGSIGRYLGHGDRIRGRPRQTGVTTAGT